MLADLIDVRIFTIGPKFIKVETVNLQPYKQKSYALPLDHDPLFSQNFRFLRKKCQSFENTELIKKVRELSRDTRI